MGYTTDFSGQFNLDNPLTEAHAAYLEKFAETRRVKRDSALAESLPDPIREAAKLGIGIDGGYFVGETGFAGQNEGTSVVEYNSPPEGQPGLWCQWVPSEDKKAIEWDGNEKFYDYEKWICYLIKHFLEPWGYTLNGSVEWQGEDEDDCGIMTIENNKFSSEDL